LNTDIEAKGLGMGTTGSGLLSKNRLLAFRRLYFPEATDSQWNRWEWQARNSIQTLSKLEKMITLSEDERAAIGLSENGTGIHPFKITPYYAALIDRDNPAQAIRRSVIPVTAESIRSTWEDDDPLLEEPCRPTPCIVNRYPDRALFLATNLCAAYCRYCTRSRIMVRHCNHSRTRSRSFNHSRTMNRRFTRLPIMTDADKPPYNLETWKKAIAFLKDTPAIRDVLISGGDPLMLPDEKLDWLLSNLHRISHIELLRIGTKIPIVMPQRITPTLTRILKRYHPLWMSIHILHPEELTPEAVAACSRLADAGIPLGSQTVLLAGINDTAEVIKALVHTLLRIRIRPYYLFHCDPVSGSAHLRTPVKKGLEIIKALRGYTTGYAIPTYAIDIPGRGGKVALHPESILARAGDYILVRNYEGRLYRYPDPE